MGIWLFGVVLWKCRASWVSRHGQTHWSEPKRYSADETMSHKHVQWVSTLCPLGTLSHRSQKALHGPGVPHFNRKNVSIGLWAGLLLGTAEIFTDMHTETETLLCYSLWGHRQISCQKSANKNYRFFFSSYSRRDLYIRTFIDELTHKNKHLVTHQVRTVLTIKMTTVTICNVKVKTKTALKKKKSVFILHFDDSFLVTIAYTVVLEQQLGLIHACSTSYLQHLEHLPITNFHLPEEKPNNHIETNILYTKALLVFK